MGLRPVGWAGNALGARCPQRSVWHDLVDRSGVWRYSQLRVNRSEGAPHFSPEAAREEKRRQSPHERMLQSPHCPCSNCSQACPTGARHTRTAADCIGLSARGRVEREEKQQRANGARHKGPAASALPAAASAQRKAAAAAAAARGRMRREQTNLVATRRLLDEANSTDDEVTPTFLERRLNLTTDAAATANRDRRAKAKRLLLALARFPRWLPPWAISFLVTACVLMAGFCGYLCTRAVLDSYDAGEACADKMPPSNHVRQCARPLGPPPPPRDMEFGRAPRKQTSRPPFLAAAQDSDRTVGLDAAQLHSLRGATHLRETV